MASSLEKKQIDELLAKYQASTVRKQRRVEELEQQNKNLLAQISSSLIVPATAFGMSYARARYGDEASSICGIPIDATAGLALTMFATLLDCSSDEGAQTAAKFLHDFGNGALASWSAALGAEFGAKKRMERPVQPQPNTRAEETPERVSRPPTHEELDEIIAVMRSKAHPAMQERPVQRKANPLPTAEPVATTVPAPAPAAQSARPSGPPLNEQATPIATNAKSGTAPMAPLAPQEPNCATKPWEINPEAEMRALLQSHGAPSDPKTVAYVLMHKNPIEAHRQIVERARVPAAALSTTQKPSRATKPWTLDPEAEMRRLLQSHGAASDPNTVAHVLAHENAIEAFRKSVRGAQTPTTNAANTKVLTQSKTPPESPLSAPPTTKKKPRRSLAAARTAGIAEAAVASSPQIPPKPDPMELPKPFVQESKPSVPITQEELEAAARWRLLTAA